MFLGTQDRLLPIQENKNFTAVLDVYVKNELLYRNPYAKNMNFERDVRKGGMVLNTHKVKVEVISLFVL